MKRRSLSFVQLATLALFVLALGYLGWIGLGMLPSSAPVPTPTPSLVFSGEQAMSLARAQCEFGPRPTGSPAGWRTGNWIIQQLEEAGWEVETFEFVWNDIPVRNIIAGAGEGPPVMIGAHYDTRLLADQDPDPAQRNTPVLGGNDGASGVAVLLELARVLDVERLENEVWLTFFDAEDNGNIEGWEWAIGSTRLAEELETLPAALILLDMVGDADQRFPYEGNSHPILREDIWNLAAELGYGDTFVPEAGAPIVDDHVSFIRQGVPAVDIIDFDYPYWHTTSDTCEKLDAESLNRVGRVIQEYLQQNRIDKILPRLSETQS